jgi:hypothetical protein
MHKTSRNPDCTEVPSRLLFLDFDGVLHPASASSVNFFSQITLLADAMVGRRCEIVISSSWRHHYKLIEIVAMFPTLLQTRIMGTTGQPHIGKWPRYNEILSYLRGIPVDFQWRALDDSWIEFPPDCPELIRCNPNFGMQRDQALMLQDWLES